MQTLIAVLILSVSIAVPNPDPHDLGCFNQDYAAPVTAEDGSIIACPAVYYADQPVIVPAVPEWSRYYGIR
jgi:hypothetical protein